jgi:sRNA-binding protein
VVAQSTPADKQRAEELAAKEAELAKREAELAQKEQDAERARREAESLAQKKAAKAAKAVAPKRVASSPPKKPAAMTSASASKPTPLGPLVVPSGTQLSIEVVEPLTTKTAHVGDRINAKLASDVMVDGRTALSAGAAVQGTVTEVVSGSRQIGGVPTLGMTFERLTLADGSTVPLNGKLMEQGKSETAKDVAKIAGGVVVGAVIGHQIDSDKGKVIGGILGGAAGALIARNTGGEISVPAGTTLAIELTAPITVHPH